MQAFMNRSAFENNIHQVEIKGCGGLSWRKEHNTGATLSEGEQEKWDYKRRINENTRSSITAHVFIRSSVLKPYMGLSGLAFSLVVALASTGLRLVNASAHFYCRFFCRIFYRLY